MQFLSTLSILASLSNDSEIGDLEKVKFLVPFYETSAKEDLSKIFGKPKIREVSISQPQKLNSWSGDIFLFQLR